jgi:hypothetical protein
VALVLCQAQGDSGPIPLTSGSARKRCHRRHWSVYKRARWLKRFVFGSLGHYEVQFQALPVCD